MIRPSTTPDHLTAYIEALRAGHSTPKAIRSASGLTERQRINVQRIAQGRGLVTWSSKAGWTVVGEATKRCPRCGVVGPIESLFGYRTPTGGARRAQSYCIACRRALRRAQPQPQP
jgi:hypothetical protein